MGLAVSRYRRERKQAMKPVLQLMADEQGNVSWFQPDGANIHPVQMSVAHTMLTIMLQQGMLRLMTTSPAGPQVSLADPSLIAAFQKRMNGRSS